MFASRTPSPSPATRPTNTSCRRCRRSSRSSRTSTGQVHVYVYGPRSWRVADLGQDRQQPEVARSQGRRRGDPRARRPRHDLRQCRLRCEWPDASKLRRFQETIRMSGVFTPRRLAPLRSLPLSLASPGRHRSDSGRRVPSSARVRVCRGIWGSRCVCRRLAKRLPAAFAVLPARHEAMRPPERNRSPSLIGLPAWLAVVTANPARRVRTGPGPGRRSPARPRRPRRTRFPWPARRWLPCHSSHLIPVAFLGLRDARISF